MTATRDPSRAGRPYDFTMDMSGDHAIALMGLLFLPVAVMPALLALQTAARTSARAARFWSRIEMAGPATRRSSLLLLATADIHLTLVPVHLAERQITALLFLVDGLALTAAALAAFSMSRWRMPALTLLVANVLIYAVYVGAGWEGADVVGVVTKLVELAGVAAVLRTCRESPDPSRSAGPGVSVLVR